MKKLQDCVFKIDCKEFSQIDLYLISGQKSIDRSKHAVFNLAVPLVWRN